MNCRTIECEWRYDREYPLSYLISVTQPYDIQSLLVLQKVAVRIAPFENKSVKSNFGDESLQTFSSKSSLESVD